MRNLILIVSFLFAQAAVAAPVSLESQKVTVASCSGAFLNLKNELVKVTVDKLNSNYDVVWIDGRGISTILRTIKTRNDKKFELQCLHAKEAVELKKSLTESETIRDFLQLPKSSGLLCYFVDDVSAECWGYDSEKRTLVKVGGWQT